MKKGKLGYLVLIVIIIALVFSIPYMYEVLNNRNIDEITSEITLALNSENVADELNDSLSEYDYSIVVQSSDFYYSTFDTQIENIEDFNLSEQYYNTLDSENGYTYSLYVPPIDFNSIYPYILFVLLVIIILILIWNAIFVRFIISLIVKPMATLKNNIHNLRNYDFKDVENETQDKINNELIKFSEDLNDVLKQYNVSISQKESEYYKQVVLNENKEHYLTTVIHDFKGELENIKAGSTDEGTINRLNELKLQTEENIKLAVTEDDSYFTSTENINLKIFLFKLVNKNRGVLDSKDIFVSFEIGDYNINVNEVIINQLFTNIISNAIKHTTQYGKIKMQLDGNKLYISNDISEDVDVEKIFSLNYSSTNTTNIGYGMYRIKQIISEIGWGIDVYTKDNMFFVEIDLEDYNE